ncbi:MAG: cephalosporin hydroxylase family protein [Dokdonella sp.]
MSDFQEDTRERLHDVRANSKLLADARAFTESSVAARYSYNFLWQGRPIIQYPQDMVALQELVWATRPDLIIETGIAHGGSLVLSASLLTMLDYADAAADGQLLDPRAPRRRVLGIDIDIRQHNREAILAHPLAARIDMLQGSSIDPDIIAQVAQIARGFERVMVCLDSNHTHDHVLAELQAYAPLVSPGCYCVVFDTVIEDLPTTAYPDRPWDIGNNPRTAVKAYLATHPEFVVDAELEAKLLITVAPGGYLRRLNPA